MPKGKLASRHLTAGMRNWTNLEIEAVFFSIEYPRIVTSKHRTAMKRVLIKFRDEYDLRKLKENE